MVVLKKASGVFSGMKCCLQKSRPLSCCGEDAFFTAYKASPAGFCNWFFIDVLPVEINGPLFDIKKYPDFLIAFIFEQELKDFDFPLRQG